MSERPRLLFLCQTLPYPPDGGVWIRSYHVLRLLSQAFDVTALCFERSGGARRRGSYDAATSVDALRRLGSVEAFPIPQDHSRLRYAWNHLRSGTLGRVYTRFLYESRAFEEEILEVQRGPGFDLVHADSLDLSRYFPLFSGTPLVCVHHNVESDLLFRRGDFQHNRLVRAYYRHQGRLYAKEEEDWVPRVTLNVVVSEADAASLARRAPGSRFAVVPNGVDVEEFQPEVGDERGIAYIGGTEWSPNLDALEFFCGEILPHLRAAGGTLPVRWVGSASDEQKRHYRDQFGVELTGYVPDVRPYMRDTFCNIVPLRVGGGTRLKILNSWAMGKAVVSTSRGCEGLEASDGQNLLVRDDPKSFADAISTLARDAALRRELGINARRTAERTYSWDVIGERMNRTYLDLTKGNRPQA